MFNKSRKVRRGQLGESDNWCGGIVGGIGHSSTGLQRRSRCCNPIHRYKNLVNRLSKKLGLNTTLPYKPWFDDEKQVGGWTQVYGENNKLAYETIRGASHMAPLSSPKRSLTLFAAFLAGKPLAA
ncbi:unnamed protein product [Linum tenue]|uniref:Uncharacterized protein n=1 Tax=Linum tenue TaxID=586396 RepID=A0AAV0P171_9ROSI|nr:unnamed protein product [Linum tenue]